MPSDAETERLLVEDVQAQIKKTADATHLSGDYQVAQTTYWSAEIRKIDGRSLEVNDQSTSINWSGVEVRKEQSTFLIRRLMSN